MLKKYKVIILTELIAVVLSVLACRGVYDFLQNYNITWDMLGTSEDKFYSNFFNFDVSNSPTERRSYYTYIVQNDDLLLKWSKESLNKLYEEREKLLKINAKIYKKYILEGWEDND